MRHILGSPCPWQHQRRLLRPAGLLAQLCSQPDGPP